MANDGINYTISIHTISGVLYNIQHTSTYEDIKEGFANLIKEIYEKDGIYHFDRSQQKATYIPMDSIDCIECTLED
jgi:hypothetical protein